MPDAKDNAKLTGDTHLPEIEDDLPQSNEDLRKRPPGNGGEIKNKDAETSASYGNTRESGERPK